MPLTPFTGDKPQRNDRTTFSSRVDAFVTWWLDTFWDELDAALQAFNFNATNSTSTTSLLISAASKTLTVQTSKSYVKGMAVTIAYTTDPTQWMRGEVTSYNSGTGELIVNVRYISDTIGTYATWTISQAAIEASVLDSRILITGGSGQGSSSTKIDLLTTTVLNTGTAFSINHSATLGSVLTINEPGIFTFCAKDFKSTTNGALALTLNATGAELTSAYAVVPQSRWVGGLDVLENTAGQQMNLSVTDRLVAGDTIRLHCASSVNDGSGTQVSLYARKIGNV